MQFISFLVSCGENFVASNNLRTFSTPNFPDVYPSDLNCYWVINSEDNEEYDVTLSEGATENESDFVEVNRISLFNNVVNY